MFREPAATPQTLHGILRVKFPNRRLGDHRARQVGVLTGTAIIVLPGWIGVPWIDPSTKVESLLVGILWMGAMLVFDIAFGRL